MGNHQCHLRYEGSAPHFFDKKLSDATVGHYLGHLCPKFGYRCTYGFCRLGLHVYRLPYIRVAPVNVSHIKRQHEPKPVPRGQRQPSAGAPQQAVFLLIVFSLLSPRGVLGLQRGVPRQLHLDALSAVVRVRKRGVCSKAVLAVRSTTIPHTV